MGGRPTLFYARLPIIRVIIIKTKEDVKVTWKRHGILGVHNEICLVLIQFVWQET